MASSPFDHVPQDTTGDRSALIAFLRQKRYAPWQVALILLAVGCFRVAIFGA